VVVDVEDAVVVVIVVVMGFVTVVVVVIVVGVWLQPLIQFSTSILS